MWQVIGPGFDRIGDWASFIPHSSATSRAGPDAGGGLPGRTCEASLPGVPAVSEQLIAYDDDRKELTYVAARGLPRFVAAATNTWRVDAETPESSTVSVAATLQGTGLIGRALCTAMVPMLLLVGRVTLRDLAHFVERGEPSPRKRSRDVSDVRGSP